MTRRLVAAMTVGALWALAATVAGTDLEWVLLGAAVIGMLFTVGIEPPRRRWHRRRVAKDLASLEAKGLIVRTGDDFELTDYGRLVVAAGRDRT